MSGENESENSIKCEEEEMQRPETPEQSEGGDKEEQLSIKKRLHRKQQISNFIMKTYKILQEKKNYHIIEWTDNGNCFIVKNKDLFENEILPKYFKHKKFSSFVRQLNMYDFHKIRKEKEIPIFKHKFFKMGCFELLHKIKRKSGEDGKDDETVKNIMSQPDISVKNEDIPLKSAYSVKSKGVVNISEEIEFLNIENNELKNNIAEINKEITQFELNRNKKQEKLVKIFSALIYFDSKQSMEGENEKCSLRQLQHHFCSDEDPHSFLEYAKKLGYIYRDISQKLSKE